MPMVAAAPRIACRKPRPLTAHRWFPAIVALWFAALFGLCALAVPAALLERLVGALGVDRVLPAASPPLGETARLLIAAGVSSIGEIVGLLLGRALGARHRPKAVPEDAPRQPLSAEELVAPETDKLGEEEPAASLPLVASPIAAAPAATPTIASAPLESLGVVQLSERLALAMRARREPPKIAPPEIAQALEAARASLRRASGAR